MIQARLLKHSRNKGGDEILTYELTYPRFVHADLMTHRMFSRNGASSRAIPISKTLRSVVRDPAEPLSWGANGRGMQAHGELGGMRRRLARRVWRLARWPAVVLVWLLLKIGLHKQWANRILEPWLHMTVILTATEFENFGKLRESPAAHPELQLLARQMRVLREMSEPQVLEDRDWHIPLLTEEEEKELASQKCMDPERKYLNLRMLEERLLKVSTARCARVSYVTHADRRDIERDLELHDRLARDGHWSPFEHCAQANSTLGWCGNFRGFRQYRKLFPNESGRSVA